MFFVDGIIGIIGSVKKCSLMLSSMYLYTECYIISNILGIVESRGNQTDCAVLKSHHTVTTTQ